MVLVTRRGRAVVTTGVPFEVELGYQEGLPTAHLAAVRQLCVYDPSPCTISGLTAGRGSLEPRWLPRTDQLGIALKDPTTRTSEGNAAAPRLRCGHDSWASLGAVAALRRDYAARDTSPKVTLVVTDYRDEPSARRAQLVLTSWLSDCPTGLELNGFRSYPDEVCLLRRVAVPQGEARACNTIYRARGRGGEVGDLVLETAVLRVGTRIAVAEVTTAYDENAEQAEHVTVPLSQLARRLPPPVAPGSMYDGEDVVAGPVRLGTPLNGLRQLRDPLQVQEAYNGCTEVPLRNRSTAILDRRTGRVVAYQVGGASMTPRGLAAHAPIEDARAAYPEATQRHRSSVTDDSVTDEVRADLPNGTVIRWLHTNDRSGLSLTLGAWRRGAACLPPEQ